MQDHYTAHADLDRTDGFYKIGETAVCTVDFFKNDRIFPCKIHCTARIEHETVIDQTLDYQGKTLTFRVRGDRPCWVYFSFQILDPATGEPMSGENVWKHFQKPTVVEDIGCMFEPEKISHPVKRPDDFTDFWKKQLEKLDSVPFHPVVEELPVPEPYRGKVDFYSVTLDIIDGEKATGYLALPVNARPGSCPAYLWFLSWCWTDTLPETALKQASGGAIAFSATWHGFPIGQPESFYVEQGRKFNSWQGIDDRDTWAMRYIYFRTMRAIQYMKSRPEWNGKDLIIQGGSLAGSECIAAAALDKSVTLALISVPAFDEYKTNGLRRLSIPLGNAPARVTPAMQDAMEYYASANFAPDITCETCFCTGFVDTSCPPSGVYAVYNTLPETTRRSIYTDPRTGHYGTTVNVTGNQRLQELLSSFHVQKYTE